ncbi:LysM peptidoglycan-binding domain-containing protein, partial [Pseudomonas sp. 2822-17]|uniref:LysM peptidoglycan-binding domain-containing protein n=1 Tax=Pseudomonas sp. 2822-17 TaxID=1712678 RepID=UPI00117B6F4B
VLTIPTSNTGTSQPTAPIEDRTTFTYRVVAGDNLTVISQRHSVTVDAIRTANNLRTDVLQIGQTLTIPNGLNKDTTNTVPVQKGSLDPVTITNIQHTVRSGDNMWNLSQHYSVPYLDLLRHN